MSTSGAYYNEIDPYAAQWLRNLIAAGHIAAGDVDERSIEDVHPDDLRSYTQCHWFAGVGIWSYSLRQAGWPDDRPVWTGSCPCQPFSAAGKGAGFDDERHLWPAWHWLIRERRPAVVFGEQVASGPAIDWLDLVLTDMEALDYAGGAIPFPAAGVGAPHIRDRTYWVAYADQQPRRQRRSQHRGGHSRGNARTWPGLGGNGLPFELAHADGGRAGAERQQRSREHGQQPTRCGAGALADPHDTRLEGRIALPQSAAQWPAGPDCMADNGRGPLHGPWRDADWLLCRDGKWRPVEPGTFPLAHGAASRVGRLRAYGNGIVAEEAKVFIRAAMEVACLTT